MKLSSKAQDSRNYKRKRKVPKKEKKLTTKSRTSEKAFKH